MLLSTFTSAKIGEALFIALFFSIPFSHSYSNIVILLLFLYSTLGALKRRQIPKIQIHWFLPTLFLYYIFSLFLTHGAWSSMEKYFLLIAFPILMGLNAELIKFDFLKKVYIGFIAGNMMAYVCCLMRAIFKSLSFQNDKWIFNAKLISDTQYDFLASSIMGGNYFFGPDFSYFHHPSYYGLFIVFCQYLVYRFAQSSSSQKIKWLLIACYLVFQLALFQLSSKICMITSLGLMLWIVLNAPTKRVIKISGFLIFLLVTVIFVFVNPRFKNFKDTFRTTNLIDPNAKYGYDVRVLSWDASLTVIKNNFWMGVGEANKTIELVKVYNAKKYVEPAIMQFDSHNQYLDFLVGGGLFAFCLFMMGASNIIYRSIGVKNYTLLTLLLIILFNMLVEDLLGVHAGLIFFSTFISLLIYSHGNEFSPQHQSKQHLN